MRFKRDQIWCFQYSSALFLRSKSDQNRISMDDIFGIIGCCCLQTTTLVHLSETKSHPSHYQPRLMTQGLLCSIIPRIMSVLPEEDEFCFVFSDKTDACDPSVRGDRVSFIGFPLLRYFKRLCTRLPPRSCFRPLISRRLMHKEEERKGGDEGGNNGKLVKWKRTQRLGKELKEREKDKFLAFAITTSEQRFAFFFLLLFLVLVLVDCQSVSQFSSLSRIRFTVLGNERVSEWVARASKRGSLCFGKKQEQFRKLGAKEPSS